MSGDLATMEMLCASANVALAHGDWPRARSLGAAMLQQSPGHAEAYYVAGVASLRLNDASAAFEYLRRAALLAPEWTDCLVELARSCLQLGMVTQAIEAADGAMAQRPDKATTLDTLGVIYGQAHLHDRAKDAFAQAVGRDPSNAAVHFNLGTSLVFEGDVAGAEREFEACLALDTCFWRAYLFLAQLRRQSLERNHIDTLRDVLSVYEHEPEAAFYLNLALAKELEDVERFDQAFECLSVGKAAGGKGRGYSIDRDAAMVDAIKRATSKSVKTGKGHPSREPIFVIGMPRSGTTLVERILASHPLVTSAGELRNFVVSLHRAAGVPGFVMDPAFAQSVDGIDWNQLGSDYLASTRHLTGSVADGRFVDKLPHNFLFAGFIARAFPNASIICLRRDPLDTCLSNFRQVFALNSPHYDYSFDLLDTGRYYLLFDQLMAHWRDVIPGRILEVQYESLVDDQRATTERLLDFCGLPWNDACLRFQEQSGPVATASTVQVREPMNRRSVGRWRSYAAHLAELRQLLVEGGVAAGS